MCNDSLKDFNMTTWVAATSGHGFHLQSAVTDTYLLVFRCRSVHSIPFIYSYNRWNFVHSTERLPWENSVIIFCFCTNKLLTHVYVLFAIDDKKNNASGTIPH